MAQVLQIPMDNSILTPCDIIVSALCKSVSSKEDQTEFLAFASKLDGRSRTFIGSNAL
jgi:hypothetical protein